MSGKVYRKTLWSALTGSKGRLLSITSLLGLGAFALVGLKSTPANMEGTAQDYVTNTKMMDLAVMADYGFSPADRRELLGIKGVDLEFSYVLDVTIGDNQAIRLFSEPKTISRYQLTKGHHPQKRDQLVLADHLSQYYQLGDLLKVTEKDGQDQLKQKEFTIVGFAKSADLWFADNLGQSQAGTGHLMGYAFVKEAVFDLPAYPLARLRYEDLADLPYHSSAYDNKVKAHEAELTQLLADNAELRLTEIKHQGQKDLEAAKSDLARAESDLKSAKEKLANQTEQLQTGQVALNQAETHLQQEKEQLASHEEELTQGINLLDTVKESLDTTKSQLDATKFLLDSTKGQLEGYYRQLTSEKETLDKSKASLDDLAADISSQQASLAQDLQQWELKKSDDNEVPPAEFEERANHLASLSQNYEADYTTYREQVASYQGRLAAYQAQLDQYHAGLASYEESLTLYQEGVDQYELSRKQVEAESHAYQTGLSSLEQAEGQLVAQSQELQTGQHTLDKAKESLVKEEKSHEKDLTKARETIAKAEENLAGLSLPHYDVYGRAAFPGGYGYQVYKTATDNIRTVSSVFPVVLYLVAALVTLTTMTRFVDEERSQLGLMRALGYSKPQLMAKFCLYGLVASLIGTGLGSLAGHALLSPMVANLLTRDSVLGAVEPRFQASYMVFALVFSLVSAVFPTFWVARKALTEESAQLLLPKPPVSGSSILLEKIGLIWKRLTFTQKVTARNLFRYKQRMVMTVFGVAGSVALLFAGLGIRSSIAGVSQRQYTDLIQYQLLVMTDDQTKEQDNLEKLLTNKTVSDALAVRWLASQQDLSGDKEKVNIIISKDLTAYIDLLATESGQGLVLSDEGIILSEKLAKLYQVTVGDDLTFQLDGKTVSAPVLGISEHYAGHHLYLTPAYYESLTGKKAVSNAYLVKVAAKADSDHLASQLLALKEVKAVVQNQALVSQLDSLANSLQSVMLILIVVATVLAVIILYNLTNINLAERLRELSTIKVLGFHTSEVTLYIYRETMILSMIGLIFGLLFGSLLHRIILSHIGSSTIMFNPRVDLTVYLTPLVVLGLILAGLGLLVHHRLKTLDMLEALKSVE